MICVKCFHEDTTVINSRTRPGHASVWRRRRCANCGTTFTTYEKPSLTDAVSVIGTAGDASPFNLGKLILSIAGSFAHAPEQAEINALWLAQTVEDSLYARGKTLHTSDILTTTHEVLKHFDELAALQYGARHQLISSVRRRGRPSLVSHEPQTPQ